MKRKIEKKLNQALEAETPDLLEQLLQEHAAAHTQNAPVQLAEYAAGRRKKKKAARWLIPACAAAVLMIAAGLWAFRPEPVPVQPYTMVCMDINPSLELAVDQDDRVLEAHALNGDAEQLLADLELEGSKVTTASYAIVGALLTKGFLTDETNSLLISVTSEDAEHGLQLEEELSLKIRDYLEQTSLTAAILSQYLSDSSDAETFAQEHAVSAGKARIILDLSQADPALTIDSLLQLSTQELLLIWSSRAKDHPELSSPDTVVYGEVSRKQYLTKEEVLQTAADAAGSAPEELTGVRIEFDCEDGIITYEVEFQADGRKFEAEMDAVTGEILEWEAEPPQTESVMETYHIETEEIENTEDASEYDSEDVDEPDDDDEPEDPDEPEESEDPDEPDESEDPEEPEDIDEDIDDDADDDADDDDDIDDKGEDPDDDDDIDDDDEDDD